MTVEVTPIGARILVEQIEPVSDVEERARKAGLFVAVYDHNRPKPTEGIVVAVGTDPLLQEHIQVGDHVVFSKFSGSEVQIEGKTYRQLDFPEIITRIRKRPAIASESEALPDSALSPAPHDASELPESQPGLEQEQHHQPDSESLPLQSEQE